MVLGAMAGFPEFLNGPKMLKEAFGDWFGMALWRAVLLAAVVAAIAFAGTQLRGAMFGGSAAQTPSAGSVVIAQNSTGPIIDNRGIITQGQSGGTNIVVQKPPPRQIDDAFKALIRQNFPDKSRDMLPMVLSGDDAGERAAFADQIVDFLKSEGYRVRPISYYLTPGPPTQGVLIDQYSDSSAVKILIGINTRQP